MIDNNNYPNCLYDAVRLSVHNLLKCDVTDDEVKYEHIMNLVNSLIEKIELLEKTLKGVEELMGDQL
jgi:Mg2+ and Co2+ transporter CorA